MNCSLLNRSDTLDSPTFPERVIFLYLDDAEISRDLSSNCIFTFYIFQINLLLKPYKQYIMFAKIIKFQNQKSMNNSQTSKKVISQLRTVYHIKIMLRITTQFLFKIRYIHLSIITIS